MSDRANHQCPYEDCENTATAVYLAPGEGVEFRACDECAPPYSPLRELEVSEQ